MKSSAPGDFRAGADPKSTNPSVLTACLLAGGHSGVSPAPASMASTHQASQRAWLGAEQLKSKICSPPGPPCLLGTTLQAMGMSPVPCGAPKSPHATARRWLRPSSTSAPMIPWDSPIKRDRGWPRKGSPLSPRPNSKRQTFTSQSRGGPRAPSPSAGTSGLPGPRRRVTSVGDPAKCN